MRTNIKATNFILTPETKDYLDKRITSLDKFIENPEASMLDVELGKTTQHHKTGEFYKAELMLHVAGQHIRVEKTAQDIFAAIDEAKDDLVYELKKQRGKRRDLFRRGAAKIKNIVRGLYRR